MLTRPDPTQHPTRLPVHELEEVLTVPAQLLVGRVARRVRDLWEARGNIDSDWTTKRNESSGNGD